MDGKQNYQELVNHSRKVRELFSIQRLMEWDQETYMPTGGSAFRAAQNSTLSELIHREQIEPTFVKTLESLIDLKNGKIKTSGLSDREKASLREMRLDYLRTSKLTASFVKRLAEKRSLAADAWQKAKPQNRFSDFAPHLAGIFQLMREQASMLGYQDHPYDALLDLYEPSMTKRKLDELFTPLKPFLQKLLREVKSADNSFLFGNFDLKKQEEFSFALLKRMGINFNHARLDYVAHPFCLPLHPTDIRITTHAERNSLMGNLSAIMHEGGHGLYESQLPKEEFGTPLGEPISLGIHESQSRFWECFIGQGLPFWKHTFPELQKTFPELEGVDLQSFYRAINRVEPSLIRVFADEISYCLHVILRYEIETLLIEGQIEVKDLPHVWNEKMEGLIGIKPPTDREGCMQDVHWSFGLVGYFPTYALGNIYAAQIFSTLKKKTPDWETKLESGDLSFANTFLKENIHQYGRQFSPVELIKNLSGREVSVDDYKNYLEAKYAEFKQ